MNRRQLLAGAGAFKGAAALGVSIAQAAPTDRLPIKTVTTEELLRLRTGMFENEDRIIVERIQGSPERKIFYVHTGDLPPERCRELLREVAQEIACRVIA